MSQQTLWISAIEIVVRYPSPPRMVLQSEKKTRIFEYNDSGNCCLLSSTYMVQMQ